MNSPSQKLCACGCRAPLTKGRNRYILGHNRRGTGSPDGWLHQGQRYIYVDGKARAFHRVIVEQKLGRQLGPGEVVHHIDFDPLNNDPANLTVLSRTEHFLVHMTQPVEPWPEEEIEQAVALYQSGMTIDEVALALGRSYYATRRKLLKCIRLRTPRETHALRRSLGSSSTRSDWQ